MTDGTGTVAVVTGAASGIGYAMAEMWAASGMKVVLADIEEDALERAADKLGEIGTVIAVPADVSIAESVDELRRQADAIGRVTVVCNNAGVGGFSALAGWEKPLAEWRWVIDVNLWGVIHGVRAFLPGMVERDEGTIVNTASIAGLLPLPFGTPYAASKHAVVGLSLTIRQELEIRGSRVRISVLCPGWVRTRVADSQRNWLDRLGPMPEAPETDRSRMFNGMVRSLVEGGMDPGEVANQVSSAVEEGRFWVLPNAEDYGAVIKDIAASAAEGRTPPSVLPA